MGQAPGHWILCTLSDFSLKKTLLEPTVFTCSLDESKKEIEVTCTCSKAW